MLFYLCTWYSQTFSRINLLYKSRFNFRIKWNLSVAGLQPFRRQRTGWYFFNDISGKRRHLIAYGETDFYIFSLYPFQKQSKMCLQSPCNSEMSRRFAVSGFKNHIKQDSLKLAFIFTSNVPLPEISWWNVSHLWWHFQMTLYSCHTPSFGLREQLPQTCSLWTKTDLRHSISRTGVSEDISADCKACVYVKLIAFAMKDLCRQVDVHMTILSLVLLQYTQRGLLSNILFLLLLLLASTPNNQTALFSYIYQPGWTNPGWIKPKHDDCLWKIPSFSLSSVIKVCVTQAWPPTLTKWKKSD